MGGGGGVALSHRKSGANMRRAGETGSVGGEGRGQASEEITIRTTALLMLPRRPRGER